MWNIFREFSYVWLAKGLIYHMTPKTWKSFMLGWALATFVEGVRIRLRKNWLPILGEREVPQHRNCRWSDEFMINHDGYGFCAVCNVSHLLPPTPPTQPYPTPPHPTTCTVTWPRTGSNTTTITIPHFTKCYKPHFHNPTVIKNVMHAHSFINF